MRLGCTFGVAGAIALAVMFAFPALGLAQWDREYYASSLIYPEANGQGWTHYNTGGGGAFQRSFVNNTLYANSATGDPYRELDWLNTTGSFDFASGFVMEARLKMVSATNTEARWGGASIYARGTSRYNMDIQVSPNEVAFGSIFNFVTYPMITTDTFHTYRAEAVNNDQGKLYVDGILRLQLTLSKDNPLKEFWFGDQGWEGGEMYFEYVRYGQLASIPEPTTGLLAAIAAMLTLCRRRCPQSRDAA